MKRIDDRYPRARHNGPYLVRDGTTITMDNLLRAVCGSVETVKGTSLAVNLENLFSESMMQSFMVLLHEIAEEREANIPDSEVWLSFLKSGYMLGA